VKDRLKQLIGNALAQGADRQALVRLLRAIDTRLSIEQELVSEVGPESTEERDPTVPIKAVSEDVKDVQADWSATSGSSLQAVLDNVKDAILTVDRDGRVLEANSAATQLFALPAESLCGAHVATLIPVLTDPAALDRHAGSVDDSGVDWGPELVDARRSSGVTFSAEMTVSRVAQRRDERFVLCIRDVTDRYQHLQALRESEHRYRALVENAPEAIVVLDVELGYFVDANENAARLFRLSRDELLRVGPTAISPEYQSDGLPSFGLARGYIERALNGGRPVFEWLHCDSEGNEFPCEVRFIQLPSSTRQLIRASIIDVTQRKTAETFAFGERKILELIAANASLDRTLHAVVALAEQMQRDVRAVIMLLNEERQTIRRAACGALGAPLRDALTELPIGSGSGSCAAAMSLRRQVVVTDIAADLSWRDLCEQARASKVQSCCSTPIVTAGNRIHGTLAMYFEQARSPRTEELDLTARLAQLAGIAIRRKQDETALKVSEARFRTLFENVVDGVFQANPEGLIISANPALVAMLGYTSVQEISDRNFADFCVDALERERLIGELETHGRVRDFEYRLRRSNGSVIVVLENSRMVKDDAGNVLYYEGTITDITQRKAAERALFREKERAQVTLSSIGDAVVTTDAAGHVEYLNPVAEQLTGIRRREAQGRPIGDVVRLQNEVTGEPLENPVARCLREGRVVAIAGNAVLISHDGTPIAIQDSAAPIQDRRGNVGGAVMVFHDVSQERQLHRRLSYHASHDSLTGLINRREFEERLSTAVRDLDQGRLEKFTLLYMDLDQFKVVNDTCGHAAGDLLLRQLADVLHQRVRAQDVLARLGGDEFAVLLRECPVENATDVAEQLRGAVANFRFTWRDGSMQVGVSIGIVPAKANDTVAGLMSAADVACYVAKDLGRNRIHVYEEGDAAARHQEMQWVGRINRARDEERFELYYQPIVPIAAIAPGTKEYRHFELLLRMRDEQGTLVMPSAFIPAAERYNLMPSLDRWVVQEVLEDLVYRGQAGVEPYTLAVNLSGTSLNDARFLEFLLSELSALHLTEGALCFEITETAAISNLGSVVSFMQRLREQGCRFSLDDFGTGLSSLTYLKHLPVDYVKIDGQFIRNVNKDRADESVVDAIARMARAFNIRTIAERVESREVFMRLGEIGITFAQGYFIAVPQPIADLPVKVAPGKHARASS
jgi:diguanylate cyclase (GGDEF)-like protein/PAS domain S-box-containing protein